MRGERCATPADMYKAPAGRVAPSPGSRILAAAPWRVAAAAVSRPSPPAGGRSPGTPRRRPGAPALPHAHVRSGLRARVPRSRQRIRRIPSRSARSPPAPPKRQAARNSCMPSPIRAPARQGTRRPTTAMVSYRSAGRRHRAGTPADPVHTLNTGRYPQWIDRGLQVRGQSNDRSGPAACEYSRTGPPTGQRPADRRASGGRGVRSHSHPDRCRGLGSRSVPDGGLPVRRHGSGLRRSPRSRAARGPLAQSGTGKLRQLQFSQLRWCHSRLHARNHPI